MPLSHDHIRTAVDTYLARRYPALREYARAHHELLADCGEYGEQLGVGTGVRAERRVLAEQHEEVRGGPPFCQILLGTKKLSNLALLDSGS